MPDMHAFLREHGRIVCKPLHEMGGRSIFVIELGDKNANVIFETLTDYGSHFAIVQRYIPDIVTTGDSRVILVDGEPAPYALARIPTDADNRGNLAAGATGHGRSLNDRDRWLAAQIGPVLRSRGMLFVGLDVIGGFVTEINVTSPTGVRELDRQFGTDIAGSLMDAIARRVAAAPQLTMAAIQSRNTDNDRLTTAIFAAALLHGLVILGVRLVRRQLEISPCPHWKYCWCPRARTSTSRIWTRPCAACAARGGCRRRKASARRCPKRSPRWTTGSATPSRRTSCPLRLRTNPVRLPCSPGAPSRQSPAGRHGMAEATAHEEVAAQRPLPRGGAAYGRHQPRLALRGEAARDDPAG